METKEQIEGDKNKEIEYTYDKQGNLVQVKSSLENEKAQYVQYVYDEQGNKVRRFTGMTGPLTVTRQLKMPKTMPVRIPLPMAVKRMPFW